MPEPMPPVPPTARAHPDDVRARTLLRMLHSARSRGDREGARRAWQQLVLAELERVRGIARAHRHEALPGGRIPPSEIDDVAQQVFMRLHDRVESLQGESVGELRAFLRTATDFACRDFVRAHVRDARQRAGSLDAGPQEPSALSRSALEQLASRLAEDPAVAAEGRATVHEALAEVDEDKRMVLVMDQAGYSTPEIQERLGLSRDAVYQRRRRGGLQLRAAIRRRTEEDEGR